MAKAKPLLVEILVEELPPALLDDICAQFAEALQRQLVESRFVSGNDDPKGLLIDPQGVPPQEFPPDLIDAIYDQGEEEARRRLVESRSVSNNDDFPKTFVTLRRIACRFREVKLRSAQSSVLVRGPAVEAALDADGKSTKALEGFARSAGVDTNALVRVTHKGREHFAAERKIAPVSLAKVLAGMVEDALKKIEAPRMMRWGDASHRFVRPVRGVVMLHGTRKIGGSVMGVPTSSSTRGHRLLTKRPVRIPQAGRVREKYPGSHVRVIDENMYELFLEKEGYVVADFGRRQGMIRKGLLGLEKKLKVKFFPRSGTATRETEKNESLVKENAAMVEYPFLLEGKIYGKRLSLPRELLGACIQGQQKYFLALGADGRPSGQFAVVSGVPDASGNVIRGHERVVAARLADAEFFHARDLETPLERFDEALKATVHHHALGSQQDRALRIQKIAGALARQLGANSKVVGEAANHALRDLASATVREFPELQGRVILGLLPQAARDGPAGLALGKYLARAYTPAHQKLPDDGSMGLEACCLALAHYSELLVGLLAAGEIPKGNRDPFGLRRCAIGIVYIAVEERQIFSLDTLIAAAIEAHGEIARRDGLAEECAAFVRARARGYPCLFEIGGVQRGWLAQAALVTEDNVLRWLPEKAAALAEFAEKPAAKILVEANKRIGNIFRKSEEIDAAGEPDESLFASPAERELCDAVINARTKIPSFRKQGLFPEIFDQLAGMAKPLDAFFEGVLVNDPDPDLRLNRFRLLDKIRSLLAGVADFSSIELPREK